MNWADAMSATEELTLEGYSDWYLPSIEELGLMYEVLFFDNIGNHSDGFEQTHYWSSSAEGNKAWIIWFGDGNSYFNLNYVLLGSRPIRAF